MKRGPKNVAVVAMTNKMARTMYGDLKDHATGRYPCQRIDQDICAKGLGKESDGANFHRPHFD